MSVSAAKATEQPEVTEAAEQPEATEAPCRHRNLPEVANTKETAAFVDSTPQALAQDRYLNRGLPYVKYGGRIRYLRRDVLAYLEANRVTPAP